MQRPVDILSIKCGSIDAKALGTAFIRKFHCENERMKSRALTVPRWHIDIDIVCSTALELNKG